MGQNLINELAQPTLHSMQRFLSQKFEALGIETAALDARLLIQHAAAINHAAFIRDASRPMGPAELEALRPLVARRMAREPISRILDKAEFWSLPFNLSADTLDPRPDTETLVELALELYPPKTTRTLKLLDLGTGSGCILLSLLSEWSAATGVGADISASALAMADQNARTLGLEGRAAFVRSNWFEMISGQFELIVSNPPYIPTAEIETLSAEVAQYDPMAALDGGPSGIEPYKLLFEGAPQHLAPGGWLIVEFGCGQLEEIYQLLEASPLGRIMKQREVRADLAGIDRCLAVQI
jgi:release factor glutamine methyltransferase